MEGPGQDQSCVLRDGRTLEYWEGGDPDGRAVVFHPGSPCTRVMGRQGHDAALALGVRLVSVSRPGYGGSTLPAGAPSLREIGADTAELARLLGMGDYAVLGSSGGGPFAAATAVVDPGGVSALGLVAGAGPWTLVNEATEDEAEERELLSRADAGELADAWAGYRQLLVRELGGLATLDDDARVDAFFAGAPRSPDDYGTRSLWAANLAEVMGAADGLDGLAFDNLAWGTTWDVDVREVAARTLLWYGDADVACPVGHGQWYAERIRGSQLTVYPGEGHSDVCSNHWSEQLAAVMG
jgi:pimeloyl-ACP methyl ester carboxylesterase